MHLYLEQLVLIFQPNHYYSRTYPRVLCHDLCPLDAAPQHVRSVSFLPLLFWLRV